MIDEQHVETFSGYLAMQIELRAKEAGKTPEEFVLSLFFDSGCNAPTADHLKKVTAEPLGRAASLYP